ncbi:penicillin-binding protein 2 [Candidatus Hakubella thermalkaliphila]|nr:penicillin-binding protein 2 [Candidatus Hakubella thermalkaliphila]
MIIMAYISEDIERRLKLLGLIALLLLAVVLLRLWFLQVMVGQVYALRAEENRYRSVPVQAQRGLILDRKGKILVGNRPAVAVTAMPSLVLGNQATVSELSDILNMSAEDIQRKLNYLDQSSEERVILKEGIDEKTKVYLSERRNELPGVSLEVVPVRDYPGGDLAAHILGYAGKVSEEDLKRIADPQSYHPTDEIGKSGLERVYENYLRGSSGQKIMEIDSHGRPVRVIRITESVPGSNIYLSIDLDIQKKAEEVLEKWIYLARQIESEDGEGFYKATGGAVVILDASNGEVLAMASFPAYDPNLFVGGISQKDWKYLIDPAYYHPFNNRAIRSYAPASTYKVIPAIAGLEEGVLDANTVFTCRGVWKELEDYPWHCWFKPGHGPSNLERALEVSCGVFFPQIGLELDRKRRLGAGELLQNYSFLFGLGEASGIDLPPEFGSAGRVPTEEWKREFNQDNSENARWFVGDTINMVIGQGDLLATPLQIANLYLAIATRGDLYVPRLATKVETYDGQLVERFEPKIKRKIGVKREYFDLIERGLVRVTQKGTAARAFADFPLDQIPVAGKTGTAEVVGRQHTAWFASYAPVGDPQYIVVVMVEEAGAGGGVAAQASQEIYRFLFGLEEPQEGKEG